MDYNTAIDIIQDYMMDLKIPKYPWKRELFEYSSYQRWAANEALIYIKEHEELGPYMAMESFVYMMDFYSCENSHTSWIFSIAKDVGENILDIFSGAMY